MSSLPWACHYLTGTYKPLAQTEEKKYVSPHWHPFSGSERTREKVVEIESVVYGDVISVPLPLFHCVLVAFPITDHFSRQPCATWDLVRILWASPDLCCEKETTRTEERGKGRMKGKMHETDRKWSKETVSEKKRGKRPSVKCTHPQRDTDREEWVCECVWVCVSV